MDQHLSIEETGIQGLYVVNPASYKSDEDLIVETYNSQELLKNSLNMTFVQENQSMSVKGVLRGLHVQKNYLVTYCNIDYGIGTSRLRRWN
mgnify:CR=1 FL=1